SSQLVQLFAFIAARKINNVVFLCGDSHLSMCTDISFVDAHGRALVADERGNQPLRAQCIMASPMYGPYPFVNATADEFHLEATLALPNVGAMQYRVSQHAYGGSVTLVTVKRNLAGAWDMSANVLLAG